MQVSSTTARNRTELSYCIIALPIFTPTPLPPSYFFVILIQRSAFASVDTLTVQLEVETGLRVRLRQQRVMRAAKFIMLMYAKRFPPCITVTLCSCASPCLAVLLRLPPRIL
jgi:hypothetical protein